MNAFQDNKDKSGLDSRQFVRLSSKFPVEFSIVHLQGDLPGIDWQQAATQNVSQEGMCFESVHLTEPTIKYFRDQNILLDLRMKIPPDKPFIRAVSEVVWYQKEGTEENPKYIVGVKFRSIHQTELDRVLWHAKLFNFLSKLGIAVCVLVCLGLLVLAFKQFSQR